MIYALIGTPAAGKTTLAEVMIRYMNAVIISRDKLREMLFGYRPDNVAAYYDREDLESLEKIVNGYQDTMIKQALKIGKDVILDNTHLRLKYLNELKKYNQHIKFIPVEVDYETALERDSLREKSVGRDFLLKSFQELEHLKKSFDFKDWMPEETNSIIPNPALGGVFVFDIDGTLALNNSGRNPYDWKRVGEDDVNVPVKMTLDALREMGWPTVICSGRDGVCRTETLDWLEKHGIEHDGLWMRREKDFRKDAIVKEELWRDISTYYNIIAMFDDRQQVVDHGRALGLTVFQVAPGDF